MNTVENSPWWRNFVRGLMDPQTRAAVAKTVHLVPEEQRPPSLTAVGRFCYWLAMPPFRRLSYQNADIMTVREDLLLFTDKPWVGLGEEDWERLAEGREGIHYIDAAGSDIWARL